MGLRELDWPAVRGLIGLIGWSIAEEQRVRQQSAYVFPDYFGRCLENRTLPCAKRTVFQIWMEMVWKTVY